jgi:hypothetical protein
MFNAMATVVDEAPEATETVEQSSNNTQITDVSSDNYSLPLTKDNFVKFTSALTIIQDICNDCDINEGKIRCRTNDHKNMILMDLSSIVGNKNIAFSGLKNKLTLLSTFSLVAEGTTNTDVLIEANDSNFEFSDSLSRLIIRRPIASYLENVYLTDSEFSTINESINREDAVLFNVTINSMEKKRIAKLCDAFCSNTVTFEFCGNTAYYTTQTSSKDNVSKTAQSINLLKTLENKKTLINNLSFVLDTPSNLDITCYQIGTEYCMFKSSLNYYGIPVTIYTKSRIVDTNDDA